MNTPEENTQNNDDNDNTGPDAGRPLGFWLRVVDARITREFSTVLEADGLDRRDWMILNAIAGTVDAGPLAKRLERGGRRLGALVERGWVAGTPGSWTLTDEGRAAFERIGAKVAEFRARVAGAVPAEDFATTLATLQAIAAELGEGDGEDRGFWRGPRGRRHGHPGHFGHGGPRWYGRGPSVDGDLDGGGHHHGGPDFEHHHHGRPDFGHRHGHGDCGHGHGYGHGRGERHDHGSEGVTPATPATEV